MQRTLFAALAFGALSALSASCHGPKHYLSHSNGPWLRFERTMCFGQCPAFTLEVQLDGTASFKGRAHIKPLGEHQAQWSPSDLELLAQTAAEIRLHRWAGTYDNPMVMDLPATKLTLGKHTVFDRINGPDLDVLYRQMDSLIQATTWLPTGH
ncbi:DUF6438 domain-containing protein [Flavobacteriales bacterium]|nr:DUF6438 domain-containing protein [Flavobacteriales bacterium]